ncbi:sensor histidine kinase [Arundinibacter roseus]|uniref:Histidine kinase n=1 Tax=Arundinibacter roseus TaxID=2070510 RepID=A0A4V2X935_9BACT|nr:histidine kinase [Arundinibacter roseus]TDB62275.1 histidine kinase [Arundinibacter roseus]
MEQHTLRDQKARLIGIPLLSFMIAFFKHFDAFLALNGSEIFHNLSTSFLTTLFLWEGNRFIFIQSRKYFPNYNQTARRLVYQTLVSVTYTLLATLLIDTVYCQWLLNYPQEDGLLLGFRISLIPTMIVTLVYESVFFFQAWKHNIQKTESLARENVQSQLDALKNQLDPHFLFNSLNTLAALIEEENLPAQKYLEQLSDVYRYVLLSRERNTVTLEEEMAFLDAYIYLNKMRFRENLNVETTLTSADYRQHVAPLSVQMLVENAIKHNIVSKDNPLKIRIFKQNNYLHIVNNLQEKKTFEKSTKIGLQNIINRYKLLTDQQVEILTNEWHFTVRLPLIS